MAKILYVDMDNVLVDFPSAFGRVPAATLAEYEGRLDAIPGLFGLMDPLPQAIEAYHELAALFDTCILSTSPWGNPSAWTDKCLWVQRYLEKPAHKRLILSHHKNLNTGDYLIDDRTKNGADRFPAEHILFGSAAFPDWPAVLDYLRPRA